MALGVGDRPINPSSENIGHNPLKVEHGVNTRPDYFCYLANISEYPQQVPKGNRQYLLKGVKRDPVTGARLERYRVSHVLGSTETDTYVDAEGIMRFAFNNGEVMAQDVICPRGGGPQCYNGDISEFGCFYYKREVEYSRKDNKMHILNADGSDFTPTVEQPYPAPTEDELRNAEKILDDSMRKWLADADHLAAGGKLADINPIHVRAANHFKEERTWARQIDHPSACANCGEKIRPGQLFHVMGPGLICIDPSVAGWKAAVRSGVKNKADIPEEFQEKPVAPPAPAPAPAKKKVTADQL